MSGLLRPSLPEGGEIYFCLEEQRPLFAVCAKTRMSNLLFPGQLILCELLCTEDTASLGSILCFLTCSSWNRGDFIIQPGLVQLQPILSTSFEDLSGAHGASCVGGPCPTTCKTGHCGEACSSSRGLSFSVISSQPSEELATHTLLS